MKKVETYTLDKALEKQRLWNRRHRIKDIYNRTGLTYAKIAEALGITKGRCQQIVFFTEMKDRGSVKSPMERELLNLDRWRLETAATLLKHLNNAKFTLTSEEKD